MTSGVQEPLLQEDVKYQYTQNQKNFEENCFRLRIYCTYAIAFVLHYHCVIWFIILQLGLPGSPAETRAWDTSDAPHHRDCRRSTLGRVRAKLRERNGTGRCRYR